MILGEGNEKMSKSKGNVVNPDEIISSHGADTLRLYEMFMGPLEASVAWSTNGLDGARRFLDRIWRLFVDEEDGAISSKIQVSDDKTLEKSYHQTVKKVTEDYEGIRFNTAISQMMVFINDCYKADVIPAGYADGFVKMLAPIVPHIAEELWQLLGHHATLSYEQWPVYDESKLVDDEVEIAVQVAGKVRAKIIVAKDASKEEIEKVALTDSKVQEHMAGKDLVKVIVIPGKLVNIVVK